MINHRPFQVIGFHSCDKKLGLKIINGEEELKPSKNPWDWLGEGIYFWEQNPNRALQYAIEAANAQQFFAGKIEIPFVVGATIELGNCLNLVDSDAAEVLKESYKGLKKIYAEAGKQMPTNKNANRQLDCAVFKHLHKSSEGNLALKYDTIRCAFVEGDPIYPGSNISTRLHIEICVLNSSVIKNYFLPRPLDTYNPYLNSTFIPKNKLNE